MATAVEMPIDVLCMEPGLPLTARESGWPHRPPSDVPARPDVAALDATHAYLAQPMTVLMTSRAEPVVQQATLWMRRFADARLQGSPTSAGDPKYIDWLDWVIKTLPWNVVRSALSGDWPDELLTEVILGGLTMAEAKMFWASEQAWDGFLMLRAFSDTPL